MERDTNSVEEAAEEQDAELREEDVHEDDDVLTCGTVFSSSDM